jgi:hypothetical protein
MAARRPPDPYPDALLGAVADDLAAPGARYGRRESLSLAFVAALQCLTPLQRAVFVLLDVLGFTAADAANILGSTPGSITGTLTRARAAFSDYLPWGEKDCPPPPGSARERAMVTRFAGSFERGDVAGIVDLLTDNARLTLPPLLLECRGRAAAAQLLSVATFGGGTRRYRLVATRSNCQPAFGCYLKDGHAPIARAHALIVLTLSGDRICVVSTFLDTSFLPRFGLPAAVCD